MGDKKDYGSREPGIADHVIIDEAHMTLQVAHTHWLSHDFIVQQDSKPLADIEMSVWGEKGALTIDRTRYQMYREGWLTGAYVLEREGTALARAERGSAFLRQYVVEFRDRHYTLKARRAFRRPFVLMDGSDEIGSIQRTTAFTREALADLPDGWPLPVRAFVIWLTMIQWRRDRS
jgi:hypothetical protein